MKPPIFLICAFILILVFPSPPYPANAQTLSSIPSQAEAGNWIAYVDKENNLSVIHPDGSGKTQIGQDLAGNTKVRWSSSGRYLSFITGTPLYSIISSPYTLWVWDLQTNQSVITQDTDISYAWSPTDDVLAFTSFEREANPSSFPSKNTYALQLIDLKTGEQQIIVPEMKGSFGWLPDGKQIAFEPYWEAKPSSCTYCFEGWVEYSGIHTFDILTGEINPLIEPREKPLTDIEISPQGSFVSFEEVGNFDGPGCAFRPMTAPIADTGAWQQLPNSFCVWSPNEKKLVCNSGGCGIPGEPVSIYDSSYQLLAEIPQVSSHLPDAPPGGTLLWTPDSKLVAIGIGYWATPPVRKATLIVDTESWDSLADLQGVGFGWSPDGNSLLLNNQAESDEGIFGIYDVGSQEFQSLGVGSVQDAAWQPQTFPDAPANVSIQPAEDPDTYTIQWTASTSPDVTYELRYSTSEINDSNWENATKIPEQEKPVDCDVDGQPGFCLNNINLKEPQEINPPGKSREIHVGVRSLDSAGTYSPISNTPWIIDWGFRPDLNGYNFGNSDSGIWMNETGEPTSDFTKDDMVFMFGEKAVCVKDYGRDCILTETANTALKTWTKHLANGRCYGMSVTSGMYFKDDASVFDDISSTNRLYDDLNLALARKMIAYYHVQQFTNPVTDNLIEDRSLSLQEKIDHLAALLENNEGAVIALYNPDGKAGHAVTPIAVEKESDEQYRIWVYDNNYPSFRQKPSIRSISVNVKNQHWAYLLNEWETELSKQYIDGIGPDYFFVIPMDLHSLHPEFYGVNAEPPKYVIQSPVGQGAVHLKIVDETGRSTGYDQNTFVNQIEGAEIQPVLTTLDSWVEPIYWLPAESTYTVNISPLPSEPVKDTLLSWIGDHFTIMASRETLTEIEKLIVKDGGKDVVYPVNEAGPVNLSFSQTETDYETRIELQQYSFQAGDQVQITYDAGEGDYLITYSGNEVITGNLAITLHDDQGEQVIRKEKFQLQPGGIQHVQIGNWSSEDIVRLGIDQNSDGQVDQWKTERSLGTLFTANKGLILGGGLVLIGGIIVIIGGLFLRTKKNTQR